VIFGKKKPSLQSLIKEKKDEFDSFHRGYLEAGGYDPDKECGDWITSRTLAKDEHMLTGDIQYLLKCEGPYDTYKDVVLDGPEHAMTIFKRFNMKKVGEWELIESAEVGDLATWNCGHDIMQDDDYWDKKD